VSQGFFRGSGITMCPGVDSASKNEYQVNPGGKGGRCLRLTTYHFHVPMSRNLGALNSWNPVGLFRPVLGQLYLYLSTTETCPYIQYGVNTKCTIIQIWCTEHFRLFKLKHKHFAHAIRSVKPTRCDIASCPVPTTNERKRDGL
jgi:hypothetical protein